MGRSSVGERFGFAALVAVSAVLLVVTFLSYALRGNDFVSFLFWLGLSDANNIGDWWAGMLAVLAAARAFDGYFDHYRPTSERKGWRALAFLLLLISVSEVTSLHRYLETRNDGSLVVFGIVALGLAGYAILQFHRTALPSRSFVLLLVGFGLLALGPLVEQLHITDPRAYGVRILLEEALEIASLLVFMLAVWDNSVCLQQANKNMFAVSARRRELLVTGFALWAVFTAAQYVLPIAAGLVDWLAALMLLACVLLAVRAVLSAGSVDVRSGLLVAFYLAASAASIAVRAQWTFTIMSTPVSARAIVFALLLAAAAAILAMNRRQVSETQLLLIGAILASGAALWPTSQWLWHSAPALIALWLYSAESRTAQRAATAAPAMNRRSLAG